MGIECAQYRGAAHVADRARQQRQAAGDAAVMLGERADHQVRVGNGKQAHPQPFEGKQQSHNRDRRRGAGFPFPAGSSR